MRIITVTVMLASVVLVHAKTLVSNFSSSFQDKLTNTLVTNLVSKMSSWVLRRSSIQHTNLDYTTLLKPVNPTIPLCSTLRPALPFHVHPHSTPGHFKSPLTIYQAKPCREATMLSRTISANTFAGAGRSLDTEELESLLLDLSAGAGRGHEMDPRNLERIQMTVAQLELQYARQNGSDAIAAVQGSWELVYSSEPLWLATPFWWGARELFRSVVGDNTARTTFAFLNWGLNGPMGVRYGRILQNITGNILVSDVDFGLFGYAADALNRLFSVKLLTEARLIASNVSGDLEMALQQSRVLNSPVRALDETVIPIEAALSGVAAIAGVSKTGGGAPLPMLQTLFVGRRVRVNQLVRAKDGTASPQLSIFQRL